MPSGGEGDHFSLLTGHVIYTSLIGRMGSSSFQTAYHGRVSTLLVGLTGEAEYSSPSHRAFHQARLDHRQFARSHPMKRVCKSDQIRHAWATGDRIGALRIAARFYDTSGATQTFKRGMAAHNNPGFYRQLGQEPAQIVADALVLLDQRFGLR